MLNQKKKKKFEKKDLKKKMKKLCLILFASFVFFKRPQYFKMIILGQVSTKHTWMPYHSKYNFYVFVFLFFIHKYLAGS